MIFSAKIKKIFPTSVLLSILMLFFWGCGGDDNGSNPVISADDIIANPSTLAFQMVRLGDQKKMNVTVKNESESGVTVSLAIEGTDKSSFSLQGGNSREIEAGQTIIVEVSFSPAESRGYSAVLNIKYKDKLIKNGAVQLTGSGTANAKLNITPNPVNFGQVKPGVTRSMNVNIENISEETLDLNVSISNDNDGVFQIEGSTSLSIPSGKIGQLAVKFTPKAEKNYTAALVLDKDNQVELRGKGSLSIDLNFSPSELQFGEVPVGEKSVKTVTVQNLTLTEITLVPEIAGVDASYFEITSQPEGPIESGLTGEVEVEFSPSVGKEYTAQLFLDQDKLAAVPMSGKGKISSDLSVEPANLDFGTINVNASKELKITVTNLYGQQVTLDNSISGSGAEAFSISEDLQNLDADQSGEITVKFMPASARQYEAQVNIVSSNQVEYTVSLKGRGRTIDELSMVSAKVTNSPSVDGSDADAAWSSAVPLNLTLVQLEPTKPQGTMKAKIWSVNDGQNVYFLVEVEDPTQDDIPNKFEFKGGDPSSDSNWELHENGQDGLGFIFPISANVHGDSPEDTFDKAGCLVSCHVPLETIHYESGHFPTVGKIDMWYWKAGTTNPQGKADDYFAVGSDGPTDTKNRRQGDMAGRTFSDPNFPAPGAGQILPVSVPGGDNNGFDKSKFIWDQSAVSFDPANPNPITGSAWASGDIVPGWKIREQSNPFSGRGDVEAKGVFSNGKWIIELKRAFNTFSDSDDDIVLSSGSVIPFSFAYFNNTRKLAGFEYIDTWKNPHKPAHYGSDPPVISLEIK